MRRPGRFPCRAGFGRHPKVTPYCSNGSHPGKLHGVILRIPGKELQIMNKTYTIGLDIGIASVGWCVLGETHIIDLGVRAFDKAETAKEGESLNLARRNARLMRRRLFRRAWRLKKLSRLLKSAGLNTDTKLFKPEQPFSSSLWQLRVDALDRCLN